MFSRTFYAQHSVTKNLLYSSTIEMPIQSSYCVCVVFSFHLFWTSSSLDVPAGVTQEEGHTGFLIHLLSAVRALIFLARRIQPFLSLVDREVEFCVLTILQAMAPTNNKTAYQTSFTPYREQPRSTLIVVAYPRPAFSAENRTTTFQPV